MSRQAVFLDPSNRRSWYVLRLALLTAILALLTVGTFLYGVFSVPDLPLLGRINTPHLFPIPVANPAMAPRVETQTIRSFVTTPRRIVRQARKGRSKRKLPATYTTVTNVKRVAVRTVSRQVDPLMLATPPIGTAGTKSTGPAGQPLSIGFYEGDDENDLAALKLALPHLDWLAPSWLTIDPSTARVLDRPATAAKLLASTTSAWVQILPTVQNTRNGDWDGEGTAKLLADPVARGTLAANLTETLKAGRYAGAIVDFENLPDESHADLVRFLSETKALFARTGLILAAAQPFAASEAEDAAIAAASDYVVLMAHDEHSTSGQAGPIASQDWYVRGLMRHMRVLHADRTIIALGNYAYDWTSNNEAAEPIAFSDAMQAARDAKATVTFDKAMLNPHFAYGEQSGQRHDVWLLDAVTAYNQVLAADVFRPAGYAVWRIGSEDPAIWSVLERPYLSPTPPDLTTIEASNSVDYQGDGEIMQITSQRRNGSRTIVYDPVSRIATSETYTELPTALEISQSGSAPGKIALTFDDGPSPTWTPRILDILKDKGVTASFFIVGSEGNASPGLVKRMVDEGHDVGNHTFTHPNLGVSPAEILKVELNATQRLFQAATGRAMRLFRPPYLGDAHAADENSIRILHLAQDMGYLTVGLKVDPDDWQNPSAAEIVSRVLKQASDTNPETRGQIVLLHDAGGNRTETVAALPTLIDALRAKGFDIVPVSTLAGLTRDEVMPPFPGESVVPAVNSSVFLMWGWFGAALHWMAIGAIIAGFARLMVLCTLALWGRNRIKPPGLVSAIAHIPPARLRLIGRDPSRPSDVETATPKKKVSVLIPAYNEEKVIAGSIRGILASTGVEVEIIVIDDGSKDGTADAVRTAFGKEPRVRLISIPNSGKAHAVNIGLRQASGDVIVALDADTQFEPETIARLTRWFEDPTVGAVAGNAKVGNRVNLITRWQALEYITAQNLERRALAALGCVTVVPGAVGAWRGSLLHSLGGFPSDTLAEDQDLTIGVQRAGFQVRFDSQAVAWTEAPETINALLKQRFRWAFGTLQCLWKHQRVTFNPLSGSLGMVALPQVWLFQILLSLLAPVIDLMLVSQILASGLDYVQHGEQLDTTDIGITGLYYIAFMLIDIIACIIAFGFEETEDWRLLYWLPLQRFGYRQMMYYVVVKAVVTAVTGNLVGWGKTERRASVVVVPAE
jgi:peptidoglycan-N-acetylglucosamine deacetylase